MPEDQNLDRATVEGFGQEWDAFDQTKMPPDEHERMSRDYFDIFPFDQLPENAEGFDLGCGSGRWAAWFIERVGKLHCIEPAEGAFKVAQRRLAGNPKAVFHQAGVANIPLQPSSQDFGYSLGVLHHIPDTRAGLKECVRFVKPGAPFLVYLYYRFDGRPKWFQMLWRGSDIMRKGISKAPFKARKRITDVLAATLYWPLARFSRLVERTGVNVSSFPLSHYRDKTFYTMRTDALDRFGTRLEHRYTRVEIEEMMLDAGLVDIRFSDREPFWVACGFKKHETAGAGTGS